VGNVINGLVEQDVEVITDRTHLVHVSGHPRRAELARMYDWTRPKIAIPAHGEPLHLTVHVAFAKDRGVKEVIRAFDGDVVAIEEGRAALIDRVATGRRYKDGDILLPAGAECIGERRRLSVSGVISIALAISDKGDLVGDPDVMIAGLPQQTRDGAGLDAVVDAAIFETVENLPRAKRRDTDFVSGAVERAVRNSINSVWGKRPTVHVLVVEV
jgi:ribonuclease J